MTDFEIFISLIKTLPLVFLLYISTALFSFPLGVLGALVYTGTNKYFKKMLSIYTWIFRGTPLMLQLFFAYYGIPNIRIFGYRFVPTALAAAIVTFIINYAAYLIEIIRSGLESIDRGQDEAAKVLGYTYWQKIRYITLPQAIRRVLPTLGNEAITLLKDTSLITVLAMTDLMKKTKELANLTYTIKPYIYAALVYLAFSFLIDKVFKRVELKNKIRV